MKLLSSSLSLLSLVLGWFALSAGTAAAAPATETHVHASLVAGEASIQPGRPFSLALRLVHDPHWHTYWLNPGTGLPTTLKWHLPPGFSAGEIQWPAPSIIKDRTGAVVGSGYEGETFLLVRLTPPDHLPAGQRVTLKADADWLMCEDVCVPGNSSVELTLPVSPDPPKPDPTWSGRLHAVADSLPRSLPAWSVAAAHDARVVTLVARPSGTDGHLPTGLHFFAEDAFIAYEQPQHITRSADGAFVVTVPISAESGGSIPARLKGVLTADNGWRTDGSLRGLAIDVPWSATTGPLASASTNRGPAPAAGATSLPGTLLLAVIGGLILNLMPCVFPVLGIKILGFVNQAGHDRRRVITHGLVFALGVLLSFWVLAALLAVLRAGGQQLGWGFQLQSPAFVFTLAALMLVFALNMSGVFEFGLRATSVGGELQSRSGLAGSFFTGVLATVAATPCSAPFLAPALGAALALSTAESFAIFTAIALGLAAPYLLLSLFPSAVKVLPRPGAWMETFKQFMAFPLYATVGYLVWVLAGQVGEEGLQNVLFGLVLVALGIWFYGRWSAPGASAGRIRFGVAALVVAAGAGLWLGWPSAAAAASGSGAVTSGGVTWQPWSPETVAKLREEGRIVYVDFTARWCATCQANKKLVFHSDEVLRTLADRKVVLLRGDWTNRDPRITEELARYRRSAVPFNLIWFPGKDQPVILPELLTPSIVLGALKEG
jgi:thiol:disulfide interchange protein DsbD